MTAFLSDLRYAIRMLGRNPGFSAVVIVILAVGIGANTAMFSIVDGVLLRALPFRSPRDLVAVEEVVPKFSHIAPRIPVNALHFAEWRKQWTAASELALLGELTFNINSDGEPERVNGARVSANLFRMLGIEPQIGRTFLDEEDRPGRDREVLIADSLWRRRFHGDRGVVGHQIILDGKSYEVIGVLPAGLRLPTMAQIETLATNQSVPEIWKPFAVRDDELSPMGEFDFACIARLRGGVTISRALDELNAVQARIALGFPEKVELRAAIDPLDRKMTSRSRQGLLMLLAAVAAILLIVCVNIASLLISRGAGRTRELAVRAALGASGGRLLRQMLTESAVIAMVGGALGLALAYSLLGVMLAHAPANLPRLNEIRIDGRVLLAAFVLSLGSAVLFGLAPAWRSSRADPQRDLTSGGRGRTQNRRTGRLRSALVSLEVGLSTTCLLAAGLLLNSFVRLARIDRGFDAERVITVNLSLSASRYPDMPKRAEFVRGVLDRVRALPGVSAAGITTSIPLTGRSSTNLISIEGTRAPMMERPMADFSSVSGGYFSAIGIPLLAGRLFDEQDRGHGVVVISALTAARVWPGENAIGKRFRLGGDNQPLMEIVGVTGDVRADEVQSEPNPTVYVPYWQRDRQDLALVVRTRMDPASIATAVRGEIRSMDAQLPVPRFRAMPEIVAAAFGERRFQLELVLLFAAVGLVLAGLGIYGVVSYSVEQRRSEMGIRMALGATGPGLRRMVVMESLGPVAVGLAAGLAGTVAIERILRGLLFGVGVADPPTVAGVMLVVLTIAATACYVPASRITRSNQLTWLRWEQ
jgi:putative ABC transport system permease protein